MIVAWAIPDVPRKIRDQIKREEYLAREIIIREERRKMDVNTAAERLSQVTDTEPTINKNSGENIQLYPLSEESDNNFRRRKQNGDIEIENTIL